MADVDERLLDAPGELDGGFGRPVAGVGVRGVGDVGARDSEQAQADKALQDRDRGGAVLVVLGHLVRGMFGALRGDRGLEPVGVPVRLLLLVLAGESGVLPAERGK